MERGAYVDDCVAAFPSVTPVCAASIATGTGPDQHRIPSMNWYDRARGTLRRVRLELRREPPRRRAALAHRHGLQHERQAPRARGADRLRAARRRRPAHRRHDVPDLPRPPPPPGRERDGARADRRRGLPRVGDGAARAVLRRPVREPPHRLPRPARDAGPARPAQRLRRRAPGRARPVRLPAVLAARQRRLLAPQRPARAGRLDRRRRPPARAARARRRRARALPRRARDDRARRPLARGGRAAHRADERVRGVGRRAAAAERRARPRRARDADAPSAEADPGAQIALGLAQRSAMVYVLDEERRERLTARAAREAGDDPRRRPRDAADGAARGRRSSASAASCASRPAATSSTCAGGAGASTASSRR